jgi:4-carboxymuconolactone decarboxylase
MPRLPEILERESLSPEMRHVWDYMLKTRGKVLNSYAVMMHAPELVSRVMHLGSYVRFESSLDEKMIEVLALTTSVELGNAYERTIHTAMAARKGVPAPLVDDIVARRELGQGAEEIRVPVACARELARSGALSDATFDAARAALGSQGVVELIATVGYYAMLAFLHNALQVRLPASAN